MMGLLLLPVLMSKKCSVISVCAAVQSFSKYVDPRNCYCYCYCYFPLCDLVLSYPVHKPSENTVISRMVALQTLQKHFSHN